MHGCICAANKIEIELRSDYDSSVDMIRTHEVVLLGCLMLDVTLCNLNIEVLDFLHSKITFAHLRLHHMPYSCQTMI
jgi:hypothetical protein